MGHQLFMCLLNNFVYSRGFYIRTSCGGVAHLGERLNGIQEVVGSIPIISTTTQPVCVTGWVCIWARGSVGRALRSHRRGREFESLRVHHVGASDFSLAPIFLIKAYLSPLQKLLLLQRTAYKSGHGIFEEPPLFSLLFAYFFRRLYFLSKRNLTSLQYALVPALNF